ncbi:MAG: 23S rRNA (uracil(1939)-C(5))-methyltransferase RlmD [Woeseiaceae bacterium]
MARRRREPETARIESVTHDGRGIAALNGKKVFVTGALAGEEVRFVRRKSRRNFDEAELLEVLQASPNRVAARCAVYGRCGGCAMQHISADEQRAIKQQALADSLARIGKVEPQHWLKPVTGPDWCYRRRARLAVKDVAAKGRVLVGFRERHAPYVTDMHRCEVLAAPMDGLLDNLSELLGGLSIRARIPQIEVAIAENAVALVFRVLDPPNSADEDVLRKFSEEHHLRVYLQPGGLDSISLLHPDGAQEPLYYLLPEHDVRIEFEPADFVQVNGDVNRGMVAAAIEQLDPQPGDRTLDLYCGIGNFSLPLARLSAEVVGIEVEVTLVARAAANATRNGLTNVAFRCADLAAIDGSEVWLREHWDRVLLDPARSGAAEIVANMHVLQPQRIVYVSCHPGTLARDAGALVNEQGFRLEAAGIIDMFPHTAHVESIAVFIR